MTTETPESERTATTTDHVVLAAGLLAALALLALAGATTRGAFVDLGPHQATRGAVALYAALIAVPGLLGLAFMGTGFTLRHRRPDAYERLPGIGLGIVVIPCLYVALSAIASLFA